MRQPKWFLPEEVAELLRVSVEDVNRLCDARQFGVLELPNGQRRIDAQTFRIFIRARQLGYEPVQSA